MDNLGVSERPTGFLGELHDLVRGYSNEPASEIERIANQALTKRMIDEKLRTVLEYRIPFAGKERQTLENVGSKLEVGREMVRHLEKEAYLRLRRLIIFEKNEYSPEMPIDVLLWTNAYTGTRSINALSAHFGKVPSISEVINLFKSLEERKEPLRLKNYGHKCGQDTYKVFERACIELPRINIL